MTRRRKVYFIKPIGMNGPIKIGCSRSPDGRVRTLATWSPFELELVAEIEGGLDLEARLHTMFCKHWRHREWFDWSPELQRVMDAIKSGTFDEACLPERATFNRRKAGKDMSYLTPAWRYKASASRRLRRFGWSAYDKRLKPMFPPIWHNNWPPEQWLERKPQIEALIAELAAQMKAAA